MPNVRGLSAAPDLLNLPQGKPLAYGPKAFVSLQGTLLALTDRQHTLLATVDTGLQRPRVKADLAAITGDTVTAVNAFLRPYGKVKAYWRAKPGEVPYRWHPVDGKASPVQRAPRPAPVAPSAPVAVPSIPVVTAPIPVVPVPQAIVGTFVQATQPVIETMKRWQDRGTKQPKTMAANKAGTVSAVDDVMVPTAAVRMLDAMKVRRDSGVPAFGLITGPAGTAKTRLGQAWAFTHDLPVVIVEGQSIQTASDWFGSITPVAGGFDWVWSDAAKLILTGEPCLIILDELNRAENERALNGIMGLTDWKATAKPVGAPHAVTLRPGQCIIATLNEGVEYVGTVEVDAAVRDRFDAAGIVMDYPSESIEVRILMSQAKGLDRDVAKKLVRVAATQRNKRDDDDAFPSHNVLSTRAMVTIAQGVTIGGLDPVESIWATARTRFTKEDEKGLSVCIEAQFGPEAEVIADDDDDEIDQFMAAHGL